MVYRDQETGQFRSDDGDVSNLDYTDHKWSHFSLEVESTGGSNSTQVMEYSLNAPSLDPDELAMVSHIDVAMTVRNDPDSGTANTSPGSILGKSELGINTTGTEYPGAGGQTALDSDTEDNSITTIASKSAVLDSPGVLATLISSADATYQDSTNSTGGGGSTGTDRVTKDYQDVTGTGPWIDANDDMKLRVELTKNTTDSDARASLVGDIAYVVLEDQQARPRFGL